MIRSSLFVAITGLLATVFTLMSRLDFLAPQKNLLFAHCGKSIILYLMTLALNIFAGALAVNRKFLLKDTGRKLSHFDKSLEANGTGSTSLPLGLER